MDFGHVSCGFVSKSSVAGLEFCDQSLDLLLEGLSFATSEDLLSSASSQSIPIHTIHRGIEVLRLHQMADLVEDFRAFAERQIHCALIPTGNPDGGGSLSCCYECCPIVWAHLLAIFRQQVQLCVSQSGTCIFALGQAQVETIHQRTRKCVVSAPEAGNH